MPAPKGRAVNIADAVVKLSRAYARAGDAARCLRTISRALRAAGDEVGAEAIEQEAASRVEASSRCVRFDGPTVPVDDILLTYEPDQPLEPLFLDSALTDRLDALVAELQQAPFLMAAGIDPPTRVLMHGPSGTGKTLAGRWLGRRLGLPVLVARLDGVVQSHMGETAGNLAKMFDAAGRFPCILLLDEIDALSITRAGKGTEAAAAEMARATSAMLQRLDRAVFQIIIGVTNVPEEVDPAIQRRLSQHIEVGLPGEHTRRLMLECWLAKARIPPGVIEDLIARSQGMSGADLRAMAMGEARRIVMARLNAEQGQLDLTAVRPCAPAPLSEGEP